MSNTTYCRGLLSRSRFCSNWKDGRPWSSSATISPSSTACFALGPAARPHGVLTLLDLLLAASRLHRGIEFLDVEVRIGRLVFLLDQQPVLLRPGANQGIASVQPDAVETELDLAALERFCRRALLELERAPVPDHHRAAAVLALGDGALEVVVADRMVLDMSGESLFRRVQGWTLRDGPADENAVHFQAEVVMESRRPVLLDDEAVLAGGLGR